MKFKFSLEKVLHHRKSIENIAKKDYLAELRILDDEKEKLDKMYREVDQARLQAHLYESRGGVTGESLKHIHEFSIGQSIRIERQKIVIREQTGLVEDKLEILKKASQEYKMIEKLKEKRLMEFKHELNLKEQKELDDMVSSRHKRLER